MSECLGRSNNLFSDKAPAGNDVHTTGGGACRALTVLPSAICICGRARHVSQVPRNVLDLPLVELVRLGGGYIAGSVVFVSGPRQNEIRAALSQLFGRNVVESFQTE